MLLHKLWHSYISISYNFIISVVGCKEFKLLGITIDNKYFYFHVNLMCKTIMAIPKALTRIKSYLKQDQTDILYSKFIMLVSITAYGLSCGCSVVNTCATLSTQFIVDLYLQK